MAASSLFLCLAMSLMSFSLSAVACPTPVCPPNYAPVVDPTPTACGYVCATAAKLNCPASIGGPRICGGTSGIVCPTIACAQASTYAISGPNGCAAAQTSINAFAFSNTTYSTAGLFTPLFKEFCSPGAASDQKLQAYAVAAADAYATAISTTLAHYNIYVCSCCLGNSAAYGVVKADLQAAALAQASSVLEALATVSDCYGNLLSAAYASATGLAQDVQLAIDSVYRQAVSFAGFGCSATGLQTQIKNAVARATVCTFVEVFAEALSVQNPGAAYACGNSVSLSGSSWQQKCDLFNNCPCTPAAFAYDNLGFDTGAFDGGNPVWTVTSPNKTNLSPAVIQQDMLNVAGTMTTLIPKDGKYFAVVPAGCYTNNITTSIVVPPCATSITASYVFKCNDYIPFNDTSALIITVSDFYSGLPVASASITPDCPAVGPSPNPANVCSDTSANSPGGATNGGQWTTVNIPVGAGLYTLTVNAAGRNIGDCKCASKLYVDAIGFA